MGEDCNIHIISVAVLKCLKGDIERGIVVNIPFDRKVEEMRYFKHY